MATPLPSADSASGSRSSSSGSRPQGRRGGLIPGPVLAEPLRVSSGRRGDLLQLPLADADPRRGQHQLTRLAVGTGPAKHLRQALQRPGIPARRQVQHRITREQRPRALGPRPVRDPPHAHLHPALSPPPGMITLERARGTPSAPVTSASRTSAGGLPLQAELQRHRARFPGLARWPAAPSSSSVTACPAATASRASMTVTGPSPATTASALAASSSSPYCSTRGFPSADPKLALQDRTERKPHPHPAAPRPPQPRQLTPKEPHPCRIQGGGELADDRCRVGVEGHVFAERVALLGPGFWCEEFGAGIAPPGAAQHRRHRGAAGGYGAGRAHSRRNRPGRRYRWHRARAAARTA